MLATGGTARERASAPLDYLAVDPTRGRPTVHVHTNPKTASIAEWSLPFHRPGRSARDRRTPKPAPGGSAACRLKLLAPMADGEVGPPILTTLLNARGPCEPGSPGSLASRLAPRSRRTPRLRARYDRHPSRADRPPQQAEQPTVKPGVGEVHAVAGKLRPERLTAQVAGEVAMRFTAVFHLNPGRSCPGRASPPRSLSR
jgi:hypothetical protein